MTFQHPELLWALPITSFQACVQWARPIESIVVHIVCLHELATGGRRLGFMALGGGMVAGMAPALRYGLVQLDLPREEGPTAEATRLTDIGEQSVVSHCMGAGGCQGAWVNSNSV